MQQKTARVAGAPMPRNYGAPKVYEPTFIDKAITKTWEFLKRLGKQLFIVFAGVALDHGSKYILSKSDEKARGFLNKGFNNNEDESENNRERIYGSSHHQNSYQNRYDKYDQYSQSYNNSSGFPGFAQ